MQTRVWLAGWLVLAWGLSALQAADDKKDDVVIDEVKAVAPKDWKKEKPKNTFRQYQFRLAKAEGDPADAELFISNQVIGKTDDDIFGRWKKLFTDGTPKTETVKSGKVTLVYLDIQGTYLEKEKPIDPDFKAIKRPNYRMIRVLFKTKDEVSYVSLIGPAKTVEQHKKVLDEWLKSFK
jgi:hypothetical protein